MISYHANFLQSLGWAAIKQSLANSIALDSIPVTYYSFQSKTSFKSGIASTLLIAGFWLVHIHICYNFNTSADIATFSSGLLNVNGNQQVNDLFLQFLPVASIIYLSLLIFPILRFIRNYRYVQIIRQYGLSKINIDSKLL
ncbi:MAG: hypothetical protein IPL04_12910 [Chitinophagaceae bacterium]|nr:hypothetical protein [Chitinophagaceae bacterium]